jgi:hypothetical protein
MSIFDFKKWIKGNLFGNPVSWYHPKTKKIHFTLFLIILNVSPFITSAQNRYFIDETTPSYLTGNYWEDKPGGGDTVFVSSSRHMGLKFSDFHGEKEKPLIVINHGGQVHINDSEHQGAISFVRCTHIKISGNGHPDYKYGFRLKALNSGLDFSELSSDCEAEFIQIEKCGFFGIVAKKDFHGEPPSPPPVFSNLVIHDCYIRDVDAGMYFGETISPGMEFKKVRIYNNIVKNTGREAIQVANMVEDVEIYNNTLIKAGTKDGYCQNNILQIGDNSVVRVYNNIMLNAGGCGIITFGMGNNYFSNNYISSCTGIFIDNRKFSIPGAPVVISGNYFSMIDDYSIIKNMNEINPVIIKENSYDSDIPFFENASGNETNVIIDNNHKEYVHRSFIIEPGKNYDTLALGTPRPFENIGAPDDPVSFVLFDIKASVTPEKSGTVSGQGTFEYGDTATLCAKPEEGYSFVNWTENGNELSTTESFSFTVTGDRTLTASFEFATKAGTVSAKQDWFQIYPNPANEWLRLSFLTEVPDNIPYKISSADGVTVMEGKITQNKKLIINHLEEGFYIISCQNKWEFHSEKLIKN